MKIPSNTTRRYEDRLVRRYHTADRRLISIGKRVSASCPLTREELRTYVKQGAVQAIKLIRNTRPGFDLKAAFDLLNAARNYGTINGNERANRWTWS